MRHILPFHRIPKLITIHAILNIGMFLNYFPIKAGVSTTMSPRAILNGENLDYKNHLRLQHGQYCQLHENETPCNINKAITWGDICLVPCDNNKDSYHFVSLTTGQKLARCSWDKKPMADAVINLVNTLCEYQP